MKALCIGHAAYDITLPIESYPKENQKMRVGPTIECGGGSAANCASLLSRWGLDTYFLGTIGKDYYGDKIYDEFVNDGVNTSLLRRTDKFNTTSSYIMANTTNGSRTIIISRTKKVESDDIHIPSYFDLIICDGEEPTLSIKAIKENPNAISVIDAGNLKDSIVKICPYVTYIVCSRDFANEYTGIKTDLDNIESLKEAYEKIREDFNTNVVITLGSFGSFAKVDDKYVLVPSIKVDPVDTTAAGDIYHGAFGYFISNGYSLKDTMKLANITGAISTLSIGGRNSIPELKSVYERVYDENK